jgi:hypothetical protein
LKVGGVLVFTVEALDSENDLKDNNNDNSNNNIQNIDNDHNINNNSNLNYSLQSSGRIAHTYSYIKNISVKSQFHILEISKATPRMDKGRPVRGYIVALRK